PGGAWVPLAFAPSWRSRREPAARWLLLFALVPLAAIVLSANRLPIYLLPVCPFAAILVAAWADQRGTLATRPARAIGSLFLAGVVGALAVVPFVPDVRESGILLLPNFAWKVVPLVAGLLLLGGVFFWGLRPGPPALLAY